MLRETEAGVRSVEEAPDQAGGTDTAAVTAEKPVDGVVGRARLFWRWPMVAATLFALGGCAQQSTEPTGEFSDAFLKPPVPSYIARNTPDLSEPCIPLGKGEGFADDAPSLRSEECQQRFTTWLGSRLEIAEVGTAELSAVGAGACPVTNHDVVVSTIGDLRAEVAGAAPGTVIGIDGQLDINSDAGGDVVVTADGVTLTCASDGAGLFGVPTAGTAVLDVRAHQVRIERLDVTAGPDGGALGPSRGIVVWGHEGVISHNRVACERSCIWFEGVSGGLAEYNDVNGGFEVVGLLVRASQNVTFSNNYLEGCFFCIRFDSSAGGIAENNYVSLAGYGIISVASQAISVVANRVAECFVSCVAGTTISLPERTSDFSAIGNQISLCGDFTTEGCIWLDLVDGGLVQENQIYGVEDAMAVRVTALPDPPVSNDIVVHNNVAEGSLWAFYSSRVAFTDNSVSNCLYQCVIFFFVDGAEIDNNEITGADGDEWAIAATNSPSVIAQRNSLVGYFRLGGIDIENSFGLPFDDYMISRNSLNFETEDFGYGISLQNVSNSQIEGNEIDFGDSGATGISLNGVVGKTTVKENGEIVYESENFFPVVNNALITNRVSGAAIGLFVNGACNNTFVGNNLQGSETGALFTLADRNVFWPNEYTEVVSELGGTGANTLAGNGTVVVEDTRFGLPTAGDGYLDCDGNGTQDPNIYSGAGSLQRGGLGDVVGNIMSRLQRPTQELNGI